MKKLILIGLTVLAVLNVVIGVGLLYTGSKQASGNPVLVSSNTPTNKSSVEYSKKKNTPLACISVSMPDAIKYYQETYPNSDITKIKLNKPHGSYRYEIQGIDDTTEYEVLINAETGKIIKGQKELLDTDEQKDVKRKESLINLNNLISIEEATKSAEKEVASGIAEEWKLSKEMNRTCWEVIVFGISGQVSVKIDAKTGKVLEAEIDD